MTLVHGFDDGKGWRWWFWLWERREKIVTEGAIWEYRRKKKA